MEMDDLVIAVVVGNFIFVAISAGISFIVALFETSFDPMTVLSADVHELKNKLDTIEHHLRWDSGNSRQEIQLDNIEDASSKIEGTLRKVESQLDDLLKENKRKLSSIETNLENIEQLLKYR